MGNRLIVVDTDVIIDFFRDISPAANVFAELISLEKAAMKAISVFELTTLPLYTKNIAHFSEIKDIRLLSPNEILSSETN